MVRRPPMSTRPVNPRSRPDGLPISGGTRFPGLAGDDEEGMRPAHPARRLPCRVSDGVSPNMRRYSTAKRPSSVKPCASAMAVTLGGARSEEHTSELQSLMRISYAVFCLKKKNNKKQTQNDKP